MPTLRHIAPFIAILFLLWSRAAVAQDAYVFANVGWSASPDSVRRAFGSIGLTLLHEGSDGDLIFTGKLFDHDAGVIAGFVDSGLAHVEVILEVPVGSERALYEDLLEGLTAKYGAPPKLYKGWFRAGMEQNGVYRSTWPKRYNGQPKPTAENIETFERMDLIGVLGKGVRVEYVSRLWPGALQRRKATRASPF